MNCEKSTLNSEVCLKSKEEKSISGGTIIENVLFPLFVTGALIGAIAYYKYFWVSSSKKNRELSIIFFRSSSSHQKKRVCPLPPPSLVLLTHTMNSLLLSLYFFLHHHISRPPINLIMRCHRRNDSNHYNMRLFFISSPTRRVV